MKAAVKNGYRRARELTRHHAKSFYFASFLLLGARRRAAFALYAFCRRLDDLVDGEVAEPRVPLPTVLPEQARRVETVLPEQARSAGVEGHPVQCGLAPTVLPEQARSAGVEGPEGLARARALVRAVYARDADLDLRDLPFHPDELAALRDTIERFGIPELPFQELISGMEMDLTETRYASFPRLERYCFCVAGTVGLMLAPVLGCADARALEAAADLGRAMQLTNILRDVREDLARGRIYLPLDELAAFDLTETDLAQGRVDDRFRAFMRCQLVRARAYYARSAWGIATLRGFGAQRMVRLMGAIYGGILGAIERLDYDVFSTRAHVTFGQKLWLMLRTFLRPLGPGEANLPIPAMPVVSSQPKVAAS